MIDTARMLAAGPRLARRYEAVVAGKQRKARRRWRRQFLAAFGPGRVYFPGQVSGGAW